MVLRIFAVLTLSSLGPFARAADECSGLLTKEALAGARLLHRRNATLFKTKMVSDGVKAALPIGRETRPEYMIALWLRAVRQDPESAKAFAYRAALTKKIGQGFFDLQDRIDREEGRPPSSSASKDRAELERDTLADQKESLARWIDYLASEHSSAIEDWKKYWIFSSVIKLGPWDKVEKKFKKRNRRGSGALFPELDREALGRIASALTSGAKNPSFAKLYGAELARESEKRYDRSRVRGHWRLFKKNSDPKVLVDSLDAMGTGWCTAGVNTCRSQLAKGELFVYYSVDEKGVERIPRLAIRMEGASIAEVRGVGPQQEIDEAMMQSNVLRDKLRSLGTQGSRYFENLRDMRRMTEIAKLVEAGHGLSREDLRFLYEIDRPIQGFGFTKDPRIEAYLRDRDHRADLELVFEGIYTPEQISTTEEEASRGGIMYHYGNLTFNPGSRTTPLPRRIAGHLKFVGDPHLNGPLPELPERIDGNLLMTSVRTVGDLVIESSIGGDIQLNALSSWDQLELPEAMPGSLFLNSVKTLRNVRLPKSMKTLHLTTIEVLEDVVLPETLTNLFTGAKIIRPSVKMPTRFRGAFKAHRLQILDGVHFEEQLGGDFVTPYLQSAKDTTFPHIIGGSLIIDGATELEGMLLPEWVMDNLIMTSLRSCRDVTFPVHVYGERRMPNLASTLRCQNLENLVF